MIKIGINGYGRIGRVIHRICDRNRNISVVSINDINPDIHNIAYLANYDSTYGPRDERIRVAGKKLQYEENEISVYHEAKISDVSWDNEGIDILIDSSGIQSNLKDALSLKDTIKHVIVTNSPAEELVDKTIVYGVNHNLIKPSEDFLISSSICDTVAFAPLAKLINDNFEIVEGFLTTLHPWLGYQNLLDGPSKSYGQPGKIHDNYALGRSSVMSLIPKYTSAISATYKVVPELRDKFLAVSYRIPTSIVSSGDATIKVKKNISMESIAELLNDYEKKFPKILKNNHEGLISNDFIGTDYSVVVDNRFLMVKENSLKVMTWYDNEWGYSSRVVDLIDYIGSSN
jgi:glyceraldehyde 3-phosphate dehydrogenase